MVFDTETTVKNNPAVSGYTVGGDKGSPFHPGNRIVLLGYRVEGGEVVTGLEAPPLDQVDMLVGHNIRFDMHYLVKTWPHLEEWFYDPKHTIWDTQQVEYLLSGQQVKYASLDKLSPLYGGVLKDDRMKAHWEAGGQTEDLPVDMLTGYLIGDVENTEKVFRGQLHNVILLGMEALVASQMKAMVATWEMVKNGMCFDMKRAVYYSGKLESKLKVVTEALQALVDDAHSEAPAGTFNVGSNDVVSRMLFGGSYKYKELEPVLGEDGSPVRYKSGMKKGQVKYKNVEKVAGVPRTYTPEDGWETKKAGTFQVGDDIIKALKKEKDTPFLSKVLQHRALTKDLSTYFTGYSALAWWEGDKHFIHGELNMCSTDTGRLSSSKPNLQNLSKKERE